MRKVRNRRCRVVSIGEASTAVVEAVRAASAPWWEKESIGISAGVLPIVVEGRDTHSPSPRLKQEPENGCRSEDDCEDRKAVDARKCHDAIPTNVELTECFSGFTFAKIRARFPLGKGERSCSTQQYGLTNSKSWKLPERGCRSCSQATKPTFNCICPGTSSDDLWSMAGLPSVMPRTLSGARSCCSRGSIRLPPNNWRRPPFQTAAATPSHIWRA